MSLNSFLSKIFGNKSQRDLKEIQPIVDRITALGPQMKAYSNDELRQVITDVRTDIQASIAADRESIEENKRTIETLPFDKRQPLWDEIDRSEKHILDTDRKSVV